MKTNKLFIFLLALITSISFTSCVEDGDFTVPQDLGAAENAKLQALLNSSNFNEISIANLKGLLVNGQATQINSDIYVKGYVTSSDQSGNFFKEFFLQDSPTNPTAAIKIVTEFVDSYNRYNFGREVYINLKGLYIGEVRSGDGVIAIGGTGNSDDEVENLSVNQTEEAVLRSSKTETLTPFTIKLSDITDNNVGMFVKIENARFSMAIAGQPYHDNNNQFDTQRTLEACESFGTGTFILETSAFADFGSVPTPTGGGSLSAVVSKTFNGSDLVLALNNVTDVDMTGARCEPPKLDCGTATAEGTNILFEDMFETQSTNSPISGNGWTNYQEEGTETWEAYRASGSNASQGVSARVGAFRSGDANTIAWLISPEIDLDANTGVTLRFETSNSFADGSNLFVLISTDWDGTTAGINNATWLSLPAAYVTQDSDSFASWFDSGIVDLSCGSGKAHIAFRYQGSGDSNNDGTYELDNIKIAAN